QYQLAGRELQITAVKLIVAILMVVFALMELAPPSKRFRFKPQYLPVGGLLSGFFGGLSGHQGALRSAFLIKTGLSKEAFIATGVMIACLVDVTRLAVYGTNFWMQGVRQNLWLLGAATASAFVGAFVGARLLKQVTLRMVQILVAVMLLLIAAALGPGLI
ncbi:MAG: TSUP family transporter, partial [Phycisphaeraceae bacterium]